MLKLSAILTLILLTAACASSPPSPAQPTTAPEQPTAASDTASVSQSAGVPSNPNGEALVAQVNGEGITQADFEQMLARTQEQIAIADPAALQTAVLDTMIEQTLIEQAATAENVIISDADLESEYQANRALVESDAAWQQWLAENKFTEEQFRQSLRETLIAGAMRDRITQDIPASVTHIHARHILVDTEAEALDALSRLQNGEDFATLAASLSKDVTTREQGGDLGWFVEGELLEPVLTQVSQSLGDGQIGGPVATRLGYHIIQKMGSEQRELTPEKRAMLAQYRFEDWLRGLTFDAMIERYLP